MSYSKLITVLLSLLFALQVAAQDRFTDIKTKLDQLRAEQPGLNEKVELSVTGVSIQEFIRGLASAHRLNVSVDPDLKIFVVNNFSDATVADVLLFLARQYDLDVNFIGSIMSFKKYLPPPVKPEPYKAKVLGIEYNQQNDFLSLDLRKDSLYRVAKAITGQSFKNVVLAPGTEDMLVSAYIQNRPFSNALEKMAFANNLTVTETEDNFFLIGKNEQKQQEVANSRNANRSGRNNQSRQPGAADGALEITVTDDQRITVNAFNAPIKDVIQAVSQDLVKNYFLFSEPQGNTTVYIENATYDDFLTYLLNGSDFTYKTEDKVYLIGERKLERLRTTELIQLENRTIESVQDVIPAELKTGVEIQEFVELNGFVVSGSHPNIVELKKFLRQVDRVVPVVLIEVLIVDAKTSHSVSTGISAGLSDDPVKTEGTILPGVDMTISSSSLNELINSFNGFGFFNLGNVTPNFYLTLKAMEGNGMVNIRSTPQLATINGHEASMSIGTTEYYREVANNVVAGANTQNIVTQTQTYKSVNADLSIKIKPFVSSDEIVTLNIAVEQSDFTGKFEEGAPPGSVSRNFESQIRVRDGEMILLGGLEEQSKKASGTGTPLLSRIPIIKWFFSSRSRERSNGKLNIFIKPTILY